MRTPPWTALDCFGLAASLRKEGLEKAALFCEEAPNSIFGGRLFCFGCSVGARDTSTEALKLFRTAQWRRAEVRCCFMFKKFFTMWHEPCPELGWQSAVLQTLSRVETLNRNYDKSISSIKEAGVARLCSSLRRVQSRSRKMSRPLPTTARCRRRETFPLLLSLNSLVTLILHIRFFCFCLLFKLLFKLRFFFFSRTGAGRRSR